MEIYVLLTGDYENFAEGDMSVETFDSLEKAQSGMIRNITEGWTDDDFKEIDPMEDVERPENGLWYRTGDFLDCIKLTVVQ